MSRKDKRTFRREPTTPIEKSLPEKPAVRTSAKDTFENQLARLGWTTPNLLSATNYPITRITREYKLLNALYRNSWIAKRIINCIPEDMTKNWFSITAQLTPDQTDRVEKLAYRTKIQEKVLEALMWGRLYGGACAVILIEGHEEFLEEPLRFEDIMPNSFKGLMILDRWSGVYPAVEIINDVSDPDFGLPEYYEIRDVHSNIMQQKIHHTRIIRFMGRKLPFWEELAEIYWGASELEHVFDEIVKRDNTSWNLASLVFQCNLLVNKVSGFDQLTSTQDVEAQRDFYNMKAAQNQMRNNNGMMIIGENDDITAMQYTFTGLNDVYQSFMLDVSGACEIPMTKLFGRAPAGMNATGESDLQNYYDMISQQQNVVLKPKMIFLYKIMFMSEFGAIPKDLGLKFHPVRTSSDDQIADTVSKKVDAIVKAYDSNLITQRCAVSELHELSPTTNMFTGITDQNIADADDKYLQIGAMEQIFENSGPEKGPLGEKPINPIMAKLKGLIKPKGMTGNETSRLPSPEENRSRVQQSNPTIVV